MKQTATTRPLVKLAYSLERIVHPISRWLIGVSVITAFTMMFLVTADVFMRRVLNQPIFGAYEIAQTLLIITVFCGLAYVMAQKGHVAVDTLTRLYPRKLRILVAGIAHLFSLAIVALLCWQGTMHGLKLLQVGQRSLLLRIPESPFIFIMAFGIAVFFLVILVQLIYIIAGADEDSY